MLLSFNHHFVLFSLITLIFSVKSLDGRPKRVHKQHGPKPAGYGATTLHATGHYLGKKPNAKWISENPIARKSGEIQASECAFNLRVTGQVFAYFEIDPSKARYHGAPYGICYATTSAPKESDLEVNKNYDVFYWNYLGGEPGVGTGPIRNPQTGRPGYEDRHGVYSDGTNPDTNQNL